MKIEKLKIEVTGKDLQTLMDHKVPEIENLSDLKLLLEENQIVVSCRYSVPIMGNISVTVNIVPEVKDSNSIAMHLNVTGAAGMVTGVLMKLIDSKINDLDFISREKNSLFFRADNLLKHYGIEGKGSIESICVKDHLVFLELSGECSLDQLF
jgi:hypothetical protein